MELTQYMRAMGWRKWIVFVVPLLAASVAAYASIREPQQYRATATVEAAGSEEGVARTGVLQHVANVTGAITSRAVTTGVAKEVRLPVRRVRDNLSARQVGGSNIVEISYTDTRAKRAETVVVLAGRVALEVLARSRAAVAEEKLSLATAEYDRARAELETYAKESGLVLPNEEVRARSGELSQLRIALEKARIGGAVSEAAGLEKVIGGREAELAAIGPKALQFERVQQKHDQAARLVERSREAVLDALARANTIRDASEVGPLEVSSVPRGPAIARATASVGALALVLAVGLVLLLQALRPVRARSATVEAQSEPAHTSPEEAAAPLEDAAASGLPCEGVAAFPFPEEQQAAGGHGQQLPPLADPLVLMFQQLLSSPGDKPPSEQHVGNGHRSGAGVDVRQRNRGEP